MTTESQSPALDTRICLNRREAAKAVGVSIDMIRRWEETMGLRVRSSRYDDAGNPVGIALYMVSDLRAFIDNLPVVEGMNHGREKSAAPDPC